MASRVTGRGDVQCGRAGQRNTLQATVEEGAWHVTLSKTAVDAEPRESRERRVHTPGGGPSVEAHPPR